MGFVADTLSPWTVVPDWSQSVRETLAWRTEVPRAKATGVSYHWSKRATPARSFEFDFTFDSRARQTMDTLMATVSGRDLLLPIWPDVQQLAAGVGLGAGSIACATVGYDFIAGGKALLLADERVWEVVTINTVGAGVLNLTGVTAAAWAAGTRLYPLRLARAQMGANVRMLDDNVARAGLVATLREPCDWTPAWPTATTYQGHPVLELRPDERSDLAHSYDRLIESVGNELGDDEQFDLAGVLFRGVQLPFLQSGRAEHTAWRSLLYALRGAAVPVWLPTWRQDFTVTAPIAAAATTITVAWRGYAATGMRVPGQRDIRIDLGNGTAYHRRITAAVDGGATETLTINAALGADVAVAAIRAVSFMVLASASDGCEIEHVTDAEGVARSALTFSSVVPDA